MSGQEANILQGVQVMNLGGPEPQNSQVMLNPLVVDNIVKYLGVRELKNCRLIEKSLWLPTATKMLKLRGMIYFDGHYDEEEEPDDDEYRDMKHYLRNMSHFQTESYCLGKGAKFTECYEEYKIFFEKYGAGIKHLRVDYEFHSHFNVALFRLILEEHVPNLETLDIRNMPKDVGIVTKFQEPVQTYNVCINGEPCLFLPDYEPKILPNLKRIELWNYNAYPGKLGQIFIDQLFQIAPNVKSIKVVDRYYDKIVGKVLHAISNKMFPNLKELDFDCCGSPTSSDLKLLTSLNLELDVLRLGVIWELRGDPEPLQSLLQAQSKSLVELQFSNVSGDGVMPIVLPRFEKLERLELTTDIPHGARFGFSFGRISYPDTFPKLKYLANRRSQIFFQHDCITTSYTYSRIHSWDGSKFFTGMAGLWSQLFPESTKPFPGLVTLDIPYPVKSTGRNKFFFRLAKMFPNVNNQLLNKMREGMAIERPGFDKNGKEWIRSVDLLTKAVELNMLPNHPTLNYISVNRDYGFGNCKSTEEENQLLSVYTAVIKYLDCDLDDLHEACINGKLVEYILNEYRSVDQLSDDSCVWLMQNQNIVNNPYPVPEGLGVKSDTDEQMSGRRDSSDESKGQED